MGLINPGGDKVNPERQGQEGGTGTGSEEGETDKDGDREGAPSLRIDPYQLADAHAEDLARYCESVSAPECPLALQLREETAEKYRHSPGAARMISGHLQGSLLTLLVQLTRARTVLELGSFTGYSALSFAEGLKGTERGVVHSCDIDPEAAEVAQRYFASFNEQAGREVILFTLQSAQEALAAARQAEGGARRFDIVFIDADKLAYTRYLDELMGRGGGGDGEGEGEGEAEAECLLSEGALIVVDNTLWKGLVLAESAQDGEKGGFVPSAPLRDPAEFGKETRMVKLARAMHGFNRYVAEHPRLSQVVLPVRDGLSVVRYTSSGGEA
jgi:caffeoyl-CoA O-methyltransferase